MSDLQIIVIPIFIVANIIAQVCLYKDRKKLQQIMNEEDVKEKEV